jgi:hypothetical protein
MFPPYEIVDFKLKPWAELLMQLKLTFANDADLSLESDETERVLRRRQRDTTPYLLPMFVRPQILSFIRTMLFFFPVTDRRKISRTAERDAQIRSEYSLGVSVSALAVRFHLSSKRIYQLVRK